jgi:hypothetical protein
MVGFYHRPTQPTSTYLAAAHSEGLSPHQCAIFSFKSATILSTSGFASVTHFRKSSG